MLRTAAIASLIAATASSVASADLIFQHGVETGSRYNAQASSPLPGGFTAANTIAFTNALFQTDATSVNLNTLSFGIRRITGAPSVDIRFFVAAMDTNGDLMTGSMVDLGLASLSALAGASMTEIVNFNAGNLNVGLNDLAGSGNPGFAGLFIGIRFEGANATNNLNGWRITDAPAVGNAFNFFGAYDPTVPVVDYFSFTQPTPSYFYLDIDGALVPAPGVAALVGVAGLFGGRRRRN